MTLEEQEAYLELKLERDALLKANHKLQKDMQFMVEKAADRNPPLDGYRELGQKVAQAEQNRDEWRTIAQKLRGNRDWWQSKVQRISSYYRMCPDKYDPAVGDILES